MIAYYYESRAHQSLLRSGLLSEHVDDLAADLRRQGYSRRSGQVIFRVADRLSQFAVMKGVTNVAQINETLAEEFINAETSYEKTVRSAVRKVLKQLRSRGVISSNSEDFSDASKESAVGLLDKYDKHLCDIRGLMPASRKKYLRGARRLITWFRGYRGNLPLIELTGADILEFITKHVNQHAGSNWSVRLCSETRSFLRYLHWEGVIDTDLYRAIPKVRQWRLASLPRHLPWEHVRALVDGIDTSDPVGKRDKAIIMLIATLGLRSHSVCALELGHIAWRSAEIRFPKTKTRRPQQLPLQEEVGRALADYILHGRPTVEAPQVFLSHRAPIQPLKNTCTITRIVQRHLPSTGIQAPSRSGSHMLRYSLATRMVNCGVPIKEIADVLGHKSINTTAIYTKVDMSNLTAVALPFPGGAK